MNNAGTYEFAPPEAITSEHIAKHFNLNVIGLLLTTKEAVKLMGPEGGSIANIGSIVGPMPARTATTNAKKTSGWNIAALFFLARGEREERR